MIDQDDYKIVCSILRLICKFTTYCSGFMLMASRDAINRDVQVRKPDIFDCLRDMDFKDCHFRLGEGIWPYSKRAVRKQKGALRGSAGRQQVGAQIVFPRSKDLLPSRSPTRCWAPRTKWMVGSGTVEIAYCDDEVCREVLDAIQPVPGHCIWLTEGNNRVTVLLVFYLIPMQRTLRIHYPSPPSHLDAKKYSHKHLYYKSRNVGRGQPIPRRQYPASSCVSTCTAGSSVSHQCYHPT